MTDYKNIRVSVDAWDRANEAKHDDETWSDYVLRCADSGLTEDDVRQLIIEMVDPVCLSDEYRDLEDEREDMRERIIEQIHENRDDISDEDIEDAILRVRDRWGPVR